MKKKEKKETDCAGIKQADPIKRKGEKIHVTYVEPADYFPNETRKKYRLGEYSDSKELEIMKSVMVGHAVGDALGVPVEFCTREKLKADPVTDMRGFGQYPVPAGAWSDDTSMSLCELDSLSKGVFDSREIMENFGRWLLNGEYTPTGELFDAGRTCVRAIVRYFKDMLSPEECGGKDEMSNGNGSLMRIHPFVLFASLASTSVNEINKCLLLDLVRRASKMTHAHPRAVMGCYIYSLCLSHMIEYPSKASLSYGIKIAQKSLADFPEFNSYARIFDADFEKLSEDSIKSSGYVVDTLEAAIWCVLTTDSYKECVLKAVNLGGDSDTVAAVAGGLAGALYGYYSIPEEWRESLLKREYIESICEKASVVWKEQKT